VFLILFQVQALTASTGPKCSQLASIIASIRYNLPSDFATYTELGCDTAIAEYDSCMLKFRDSYACSTFLYLSPSIQARKPELVNFEAIFTGKPQINPSPFLKYLYEQVNIADVTARPSLQNWIDLYSVPLTSWIVLIMEAFATFASFKSRSYWAYLIITLSILLQFLGSDSSFSYLVLVNLPAVLIYSKMLAAEKDARSFLASHMTLVIARVILSTLVDLQAVAIFAVFMVIVVATFAQLFTLGAKSTRVILFFDVAVSVFTSFSIIRSTLMRSAVPLNIIRAFTGLADLFTPRSTVSLINSFSFSHHTGGVLVEFFALHGQHAIALHLLFASVYCFFVVGISCLVGYLFSKQTKPSLYDRMWLGLCNFFAYPENAMHIIADMFTYAVSFNIYGFTVCSLYVGTSLYVFLGNADLFLILFFLLRFGVDIVNSFDLSVVGVHLMDPLSLPYNEIPSVEVSRTISLAEDDLLSYSVTHTSSDNIISEERKLLQSRDKTTVTNSTSSNYSAIIRTPLYLATDEQKACLLGDQQPKRIEPESKDSLPPSDLYTFASRRFVVVRTNKSIGSGLWLARDKLLTIAHVLSDVITSGSIILNQALYDVANIKMLNSSKTIIDSVYSVDVVRDHGKPDHPTSKKRLKDKENDLLVALSKDQLSAAPSSELAIISPDSNFSHVFISGPDGVIPIEAFDYHGKYMVFKCKKVKPGYSGSGVFGVVGGKVGLLGCVSCMFRDGSIGAVSVQR